MIDTTTVQHLAGIAQAGTNLIVMGAVFAGINQLPHYLYDEWPVRSPDGYIPGVIEPARRATEPCYEGLLPLPFAVVGAGLWFFVTYIALSLSFLALVFVASLVEPMSVPASFPILYYIGVFAIFVGLRKALEIDRLLREPDGFLGY